MQDINVVNSILAAMLSFNAAALLYALKVIFDSRERITRIESSERVPAWVTKMLEEIRVDVKDLSKAIQDMRHFHVGSER